MKDHLKRISTPRTWGIARKANTFITRPNPGMMELSLSTSINTVLTEMTGVCKNKKETKFLLTKKTVLVDGKRRKDDKYSVSFGSTIDVDGKQYFRLSIKKKKKNKEKEKTKKEAKIKIVKLDKKTPDKKGLQLNFSDGRNTIVKSTKLNTRDSVLLKLPEQKIEKEIPFKKGSMVFIYKGNNAGITAPIEDVQGSELFIKTKDGVKETKADYAIVVGDKSAEITL